jgi:ABC-type multidrug transport system fused ATPase/permease subunit
MVLLMLLLVVVGVLFLLFGGQAVLIMAGMALESLEATGGILGGNPLALLFVVIVVLAIFLSVFLPRQTDPSEQIRDIYRDVEREAKKPGVTYRQNVTKILRSEEQ